MGFPLSPSKSYMPLLRAIYLLPFTALLCLCLVPTRDLSAQGSVVDFNQIEEIVNRWDVNQHLYVKGDLRIGGSQLSELQSWLTRNGPHWTVVLMQNAEDQVYRDAEGRRFVGMDAVEYALGHGLANRTGFGRLEHPLTKETDGAVFVLFLQERKFSYYGSDAQDRRGLGESRWVGDLDREAIRAMRGGGRIIDAVKNTVRQINDQLAEKIVQEQQAAERRKQELEQAQRERERTFAAAQARIADTETKLLSEIERAANLFRQSYPEAAASNLANPPLSKWREELKALKVRLTEDNAREVSQLVEQQRGQLEAFLDGYAVHGNFAETVGPLQSRWDQVTTFGRGLATESSREAEIQLAKAKELHSKGDIAFVSALDQARLALDRADGEIFAEKERLEAEAAQRQAIRNALLGAGGVLLLLLGFIGWLLNRRRRPSLQRAEDAFAKAEPFVREQLAEVEPLLKQGTQTLGTAQSLAKRGYSGKTMELGQQLLKQHAQLQEMGREAKTVLKAASGTMHPFNPLSQLSNLISSGPYEHALNLVSGQSLKLPAGLEELDRVDPIGWIGFAEFTGIARDLADELKSGLQVFAQATESAKDETRQLDKDLEELTKLEQRNSAAAQSDHLFEVPALFSKFLPGLQAAQDQAEALVMSDPVRAREEVLVEARQRVKDVRGMIDAILSARETVWPQLLAAKKELETLGLRTGWLQQRLQQLSGEANRLLEQAGERSITDEASRFIQELNQLGPQVSQGLDLARTLDKDTANSLAKLAETIVGGRQRVAQALGLGPTSVLAEASYNPDLRLEAARKQWAAARSALDYGKFSAAEEALGTISVEAERARQLVEESLQVLEKFEQNLKRVGGRADQIEQRIRETDPIIAKAKNQYASSALEFAGLSADESADQPAARPGEAAARGVEACLASCRELLLDSRAALQKADQCFREGKLLEAANLVQLAEEEIAVIDTRLGAIKRHFESLTEAERLNAQAAQGLQERLNELQRNSGDQRIVAGTLNRIEQLSGRMQGLLGEFTRPSGSRRDPLREARGLEAVEQALEELNGGIASDLEAHAEATRAVAGAKVELDVALRLAEQARNDQIPDSLTVTRCRQQIEQLGQQVAATARRLNAPHSDWSIVHREASQQTADLGVVVGELRDELQLAAQSVGEFKQAADEVYRAASWSGSYGVRVVNNPGAEELERARTALAEGNYLQTAEYSQAAAALAREAIAVAERTVARKQREIRQRDEQRRRSDGDFWGGFGGGVFTGGGGRSSGGGGWTSGSSSGGGWSSGGSSSGGSWGGSSGGSGSGFGRSGW